MACGKRVRFCQRGHISGLGPPLRWAESAEPAGWNGKAVVQRMCAPCHGLSVVVSTRRSRDEWQNVVANMVSRGAVGTPEDVSLVVDYLSSTLRL